MDSKKFLLDSIYLLLREKPFNKITIDMILERSGVSRATFYRYFRDKYELMNWFYQAHIDKITNSSEIYWADALIEILRFLKDNGKYFKHAIKVEGPDSFAEFLYQYSYRFYEREYLEHTGNDSLNTEEKIIIEFLCSGHVFVVKKWVGNGFKEPPESMAKILFFVIPEPIRSCF